MPSPIPGSTGRAYAPGIPCRSRAAAASSGVTVSHAVVVPCATGVVVAPAPRGVVVAGAAGVVAAGVVAGLPVASSTALPALGSPRRAALLPSIRWCRRRSHCSCRRSDAQDEAQRWLAPWPHCEDPPRRSPLFSPLVGRLVHEARRRAGAAGESSSLLGGSGSSLTS